MVLINGTTTLTPYFRCPEFLFWRRVNTKWQFLSKFIFEAINFKFHVFQIPAALRHRWNNYRMLTSCRGHLFLSQMTWQYSVFVISEDVAIGIKPWQLLTDTLSYPFLHHLTSVAKMLFPVKSSYKEKGRKLINVSWKTHTILMKEDTAR